MAGRTWTGGDPAARRTQAERSDPMTAGCAGSGEVVLYFDALRLQNLADDAEGQPAVMGSLLMSVSESPSGRLGAL